MRCVMNKKGFTLTEIIGAIIILGVLVTIAIVTFTGSMKGFREDYYTESERTLTESGKEFFNDNRKYRPSEVLGAQIVPLNTLVAKNYIDDVKDYKGNSCSNSSYVIVIKNGKDDYTYHTCLACPGDEYSNMNDKYCDSAWTNSTTVEYSIATPPDLYKYKGIPKSVLKEELGIKASYVKKNSKGEVIGVVDGNGFDDTPMIYPDDVDKVDPDKLGRYEITYTYQDQKVNGSVTIYEYNTPTVTITKKNRVATSLISGEKDETTSYSAGQWAQTIYITITAGQPNAGGANISTANLRNTVHQFQWNKDGIWQDLCPGDNCTGREIATEMNENISFRSVDINGVTSEETTPMAIRIDNTKPTCAIISNGQHKDNLDWYTSDVSVSFSKYDDLVGSFPEAKSGIKVKNITKSTGNLDRVNDLTSLIHNQDTTGVTYIGYVEDEAENYIRCETSFKKDATNPVCSLKTDGGMGNNGWYSSGSVSTSFNQNYDATSGVREYGIGSYTGSRTVVDPVDTGGITYTGYIKDVAGNTATCAIFYRKDSTPPTCVLTTTGTMGTNNWYKSSTVGILFEVHDDNLSGVYMYGLGTLTGSKTATQTANTTGITYTGRIEDYAGNTSSCSVTFKKDDGSEARAGGCSSTGNMIWVARRNVTITNSLNVSPVSGCVQGGGVSGCTYTYQATAPAGTAVATRPATGHTFTTMSGVPITCPNFTEQVYVDDQKPLCTSSGGNTAWVKTSLTLLGTCNDQAGSGCAGNVTKPYTNNTEIYNVSPGVVKDKVGNETQCPANQTVKIDKTPPTCSSTSTPAVWTFSNVTVTGTCHDTGGSGCAANVSKTYSTQQDSMQSPGTVYDVAGNSAVCPTSAVKIDNTRPNCRSYSTPGGWTNGSVTVTGLCSDYGGSGCRVPSIDRVVTGQRHADVSPGTLYDNAGNYVDCPTSDVKIDQTHPTCSTSYGSDSTSGVSVNVSCSDLGGSGCAHATYSAGTRTSSGNVTVSDRAGNSTTCSYSVSSYTQYEKETRSDATCTNSCCGTNCNCHYEYGSWGGWGSVSQECVDLADQPPAGMGHSNTDTEQWDCGVLGNNYCCRSRSRSKEWVCSNCTCTNSSCCGYTSWSSSGWSNSSLSCSGMSSTYCHINTRTMYRGG